MQFKTSFKSGQLIVKFNEDDYYKHKQIFLDSLMESLKKIGGKYTFNLVWEFPIFVASGVIEEIIHNTCFVCCGLMGDGIAIQNGVLKAPGDRESSICYTPYVDPNNHSVINVRKCTACGHSHT